jgi:hypothetical protein
MVKTITVIVSPTADNPGRFDASLDGRYLVTSSSPFIDACRILIEQGADPDAQAVMRHAGSDVDAMHGRLGNVAGTGVRGTRITRAAEASPAPHRRLAPPQGNRCCRTLKPNRCTR